VTGDGVWPPDRGGPVLPDLSLTVGRGLGMVTVAVAGELSVGGSELLEGVLTDLIEGQGNRTVVVNLEQAVVEPEVLRVFDAAAHAARRRGTTFIVRAPTALDDDALRAQKGARAH
jgi:hypothetical protein